MKGVGYRPSLRDFFPGTRRGHGSIRPGRCVNEACVFNHSKGGELHTGGNVDEWKAERGFHEDRTLESCVFEGRR